MKFYNKSDIIVFGGSGQIVKCWDRQHNKFLNNFSVRKYIFFFFFFVLNFNIIIEIL